AAVGERQDAHRRLGAPQWHDQQGLHTHAPGTRLRVRRLLEVVDYLYLTGAVDAADHRIVEATPYPDELCCAEAGRRAADELATSAQPQVDAVDVQHGAGRLTNQSADLVEPLRREQGLRHLQQAALKDGRFLALGDVAADGLQQRLAPREPQHVAAQLE